MQTINTIGDAAYNENVKIALYKHIFQMVKNIIKYNNMIVCCRTFKAWTFMKMMHHTNWKMKDYIFMPKNQTGCINFIADAFSSIFCQDLPDLSANTRQRLCC